MAVRDYCDLVVWQKAMDLVEMVYRMTRAFPKEEMYGLSIQLRRAAVSVPSNIAEGQGRHTTRDFLHFLGVAHGSLKEVETRVLIARRLNYVPEQQQTTFAALASEVGRLMNGLTASLRKKERRAPPPSTHQPPATDH